MKRAGPRLGLVLAAGAGHPGWGTFGVYSYSSKTASTVTWQVTPPLPIPALSL